MLVAHAHFRLVGPNNVHQGVVLHCQTLRLEPIHYLEKWPPESGGGTHNVPLSYFSQCSCEVHRHNSKFNVIQRQLMENSSHSIICAECARAGRYPLWVALDEIWDPHVKTTSCLFTIYLFLCFFVTNFKPAYILFRTLELSYAAVPILAHQL